MSRIRGLAPLVLVAALTACGSTAQVGVGGAVTSQGLGAPAAAGAGSSLGVPGAPGAAGGPGSAPAPGAAGGAGGTAAAGAGSSTNASGAGGRGGGGARSGSATGGGAGAARGTAGQGSAPTVGSAAIADRTPVRVGFEVIKGGNAVIANAFGTPVNFGDGREEAGAIVNDINAHGGINGHQIQPFYADWDISSGSNGRQTTCTQLTQDDHVALIVTVINISQLFVDCAAKAHVPVINASFGSGDAYLYRTYRGILFSPSLVSLDREEHLVIAALQQTSHLATTDKVGVIVDATTASNDPTAGRVYQQTIDPALSGLGIPHERYDIVQQSDINAAVLRFVADGVKTVMFSAPSGIIEVLFMQSAEQQRYRPLYALGDSTDPWFIAKAAPGAQVQHLVGAGSLPISNVEVAQYPMTPRERECLALIGKNGEANADRHSSLTATLYCEAVRELAAVGARVSGPITGAAWAAAYPSVGTSYAPVSTFGEDLGNGRADNARFWRVLGWSGSCSCVAYSTGDQPIPAGT